MCRLREYDVNVDGKPHKVKLTKHGKNAMFSVQINGKSHEAELLTETGPTRAYKTPFSIKIDGKEYNVELAKIDKKAPFPIKVNSVSFKAELKTVEAKISPRISELPTSISVTKPTRGVVGEGFITAPMAGKIVSVKVKNGDSVKAGDVLCILEAMKMENEIVARNAGRVQEVRVSEGMPVNEGDVLVIMG